MAEANQARPPRNKGDVRPDSSAKAAPGKGEIDDVDEASMESFPASDPPATRRRASIPEKNVRFEGKERTPAKCVKVNVSARCDRRAMRSAPDEKPYLRNDALTVDLSNE